MKLPATTSGPGTSFPPGVFGAPSAPTTPNQVQQQPGAGQMPPGPPPQQQAQHYPMQQPGGQQAPPARVTEYGAAMPAASAAPGFESAVPPPSSSSTAAGFQYAADLSGARGAGNAPNFDFSYGYNPHMQAGTGSW